MKPPVSNNNNNSVLKLEVSTNIDTQSKPVLILSSQLPSLSLSQGNANTILPSIKDLLNINYS